MKKLFIYILSLVFSIGLFAQDTTLLRTKEQSLEQAKAFLGKTRPIKHKLQKDSRNLPATFATYASAPEFWMDHDLLLLGDKENFHTGGEAIDEYFSAQTTVNWEDRVYGAIIVYFIISKPMKISIDVTSSLSNRFVSAMFINDDTSEFINELHDSKIELALNAGYYMVQIQILEDKFKGKPLIQETEGLYHFMSYWDLELDGSDRITIKMAGEALKPGEVPPVPSKEPNLSKNNNYIHTRTYTTKDAGIWLDQVQYFDGLGRPMQTVQIGANPNKNDLVSLQEYDGFGRESNSWLPAVIPNNNGAFVSSTTVKGLSVTSNGNDQKPYAAPIYEASPLNRILQQFGVGQDWHNNGKAVDYYYTTNVGKGINPTVNLGKTENGEPTVEGMIVACDKIVLSPGFSFTSTNDRSLHLRVDPNQCKTKSITNTRAGEKSFKVDDKYLHCVYYSVVNNTAVQKNKYYLGGELYVTAVRDEDGNVSMEFKDKLGQVVLARQLNEGTIYDTYFVYDDFGNLRYVLPPLAVDKVINYADGSAEMRQYAYIYKYDDRNRCIEKKIPGIEPIYYVYDKADRPIFSQDGEQKGRGEWMYTIPDAFGRPVLTGIYKGAWNHNNNPLKDIVVKGTWTGGTTPLKGYTVTGVNVAGSIITSVNYYDTYKFMGLNGVPAENDTHFKYDPLADYGARHTGSHTGMATGGLISVLDSPTMLPSVVYYDNLGRVIQTKSRSHFANGTDKEYIAYNFTGQPTKKLQSHVVGNTTTSELYTYGYDHAGRLLTTTHQLNGGAVTMLARNEYDELGRLKSNMKNENTKLKTSYAYNVRSWTTSISSPTFTQLLAYNTTLPGIASTPRYGGDITAIKWKTGAEADRMYSYTYDGRSQLKEAKYTGVNSENYSSSYQYDKMGNIMALTRHGKNTATTYGVIDKLEYSYQGNQVVNIHDASANILFSESTDFKDWSKDATKNKVEYTYDKNGSMTQDLNKGITKIEYNLLNSPRHIQVQNTNHSGDINYTYLASGARLSVKYNGTSNMAYSPLMGATNFAPTSTINKTVDYVGNKIYEGGQLKKILIDGGYIENGQYHFYQTDHLGNNRMVTSANAGVEQITHYYPFGTSFADGFQADKQQYKYNGKELEKQFGLESYDYHARQMDAQIVRFSSVDPLAEKYYSWSPYVYVGNNPMRRTDPTGMYWDDEKSKEYAESLTKNINKEISSRKKTLDKLHAKIEKNQAKGKNVSKDQNKASRIQSDIDNMSSSVSEIGAMGETKDQAFVFNMIDGDTGGATKREDGVIQMDISGYGSSENGIHESTHGYDFWKNGANTRDNYFDREVKAYSRQYSYNSNSLPASYWGGVNSLHDINKNWVMGAYSQQSGGNRHYLYGDYFMQGTNIYSPSYIEKLLDAQRKK